MNALLDWIPALSGNDGYKKLPPAMAPTAITLL